MKVERIATEIDQLAQYGTILPENMQGLNEDQIIDLKLKDPWTEKCIPSGGAIENKDIYNRRNGQRPNDNMVKILQDTITKEMVFQMNLSNFCCINFCCIIFAAIIEIMQRKILKFYNHSKVERIYFKKENRRKSCPHPGNGPRVDR